MNYLPQHFINQLAVFSVLVIVIAAITLVLAFAWRWILEVNDRLNKVTILRGATYIHSNDIQMPVGITPIYSKAPPEFKTVLERNSVIIATPEEIEEAKAQDDAREEYERSNLDYQMEMLQASVLYLTNKVVRETQRTSKKIRDLEKLVATKYDKFNPNKDGK